MLSITESHIWELIMSSGFFKLRESCSHNLLKSFLIFFDRGKASLIPGKGTSFYLRDEKTRINAVGGTESIPSPKLLS